MIRTYTAKDKEKVLSILHRPLEQDQAAWQSVRHIIEDVRQQGDQALLAYTEQFDGVKLQAENLLVTPQEYKAAQDQVDARWKDMLHRSAGRIRAYHEQQKKQSWMDVQPGSILGQIIRPLERVGVYVPGGQANYPSSVLMNVIPAQVAGVEEIVMISPPRPDGTLAPQTLLAAQAAGVQRVFKAGGAQAVAALTYGTQTVPRVDKITGPGNLYVALAKRMVFGQVGIDSIAGPSEVLILADDTANPAYVAADMLAQAEHDARAAAVCITDSPALLRRIEAELARQLDALPRKEMAAAALRDYGALIGVDTMEEEGIALANEMAAEHLELLVKEPMALLGRIKHAGAIFLGPYAPEAVGDYMAGPNHVLPTNGTARFFSPLSVDDFVKKSSVLYFDKAHMQELYEDVALFAESEGLDAHAHSARIRFSD